MLLTSGISPKPAILGSGLKFSLDLGARSAISDKLNAQQDVLTPMLGTHAEFVSQKRILVPSASQSIQLKSPELGSGIHQWMKCTIYRDDQPILTTLHEYECEVHRPTKAGQTMPIRMLRNRVFQQCAKLVIGI